MKNIPSKETLEKIILLCNKITFEEMHDKSFFKRISLKGIGYVLDNIDNIIIFSINEEKGKHDTIVKINIEIRDRENYKTYLLEMETSLIEEFDKIYKSIEDQNHSFSSKQHQSG